MLICWSVDLLICWSVDLLICWSGVTNGIGIVITGVDITAGVGVILDVDVTAGVGVTTGVDVTAGVHAGVDVVTDVDVTAGVHVTAAAAASHIWLLIIIFFSIFKASVVLALFSRTWVRDNSYCEPTI
jgi:hypothetical protein